MIKSRIYTFFIVMATALYTHAVSPVSTSSSKKVVADVSLGELIDKITILEIKSERIKDANKLKNVRFELKKLLDVLAQVRHQSRKLRRCRKELRVYWDELKKINEILWDIENDIRRKESQKLFDDGFIQLARNVYITNDKRSEVKRKINDLFESEIKEEKEYTMYRLQQLMQAVR